MAKTIKIPGHDRSKPSTPSKSPNYPKPGAKTVPVKPHPRKKPS